jgi:ABC-2 type transport system ATP-binding protein
MDAAGPAAAIVARGLARRLGTRWALRGVDLDIPRGRMVMIAGPNGAGKTTLVRVLATALRPTRGTLALLGAPADDPPRRDIGMVSHADHHYDSLTGRENLQLAADLGATRAPPDAVLARVGLAARADDPVATYSAGMRKRLAFARLLAKAPTLVLLDEPYAGMDPQGAALVDSLLAQWRADGTTVIVSTHQLGRVAPACDDAVLLRDGRVAWQGPAARMPAHDVGAAEAGTA